MTHIPPFTLTITDEEREQLAKSREQLSKSVAVVAGELRKIVEAVEASVMTAFADLAEAMDALRKARVLGEDYKPIAPADRPAWQSPYGPARRRR
ncbi:hypothetical protein ACIPEL_36210 [Streptomyces griseoviridis]